MTTRPLVFLDTETDSLSHLRRPWEIGLIRRDHTGERSLSFFVSVDLKNSDPAALEFGRFWERHPVGRKISGQPASPADHALVYSQHDAARTVMQWTFGATIVGAVPSFDMEMLGWLLRGNGYLPAWHYRLRCVESLAAGHLGQDLGGLRSCMEALGLPFAEVEQHTAMGDARAAAAIWDAVIGAPIGEAARLRAENGHLVAAVQRIRTLREKHQRVAALNGPGEPLVMVPAVTVAEDIDTALDGDE